MAKLPQYETLLLFLAGAASDGSHQRRTHCKHYNVGLVEDINPKPRIVALPASSGSVGVGERNADSHICHNDTIKSYSLQNVGC